VGKSGRQKEQRGKVGRDESRGTKGEEEIVLPRLGVEIHAWYSADI